MIRSQLRPILHHDHTAFVGVVTNSLRQFSAVQPRAIDNGRQSPGDGGNMKPGASTTPPRAPLNRANAPARNPQQRVYTPRPRLQRGLDARSLGASQAGAQPANILRAPRLRSSRMARPTSFRKPVRAAANKQKRPNRREKKQTEEEEGDADRLQDVNNVYRELHEKNKPVPVRYDPESPEFSNLKDTWPALPTDSTARAVSVSEKLLWLSGRVANGYEPPYELGKRLFDGKVVSFTSEEEKAEAIEAAKKLAQQEADKLTQEKGDIVEPVDISFQPINTEDQKTLVRTLVQGDYSEREPLPADKPPVFGQIMTTIRNNETYRTPGKSSQFFAKVDSLLSAKRPAAAKRG